MPYGPVSLINYKTLYNKVTEKKRYEKPLIREYRLDRTLPLLSVSGPGLPGGLDDGGLL
jgi:hypothetical protein